MNRVTPSPMYGDSVPEVNTNLCPQLTNCWCQDPEEDVDVASAILTFISVSLCVLLFPVSWLVCLMVVAEYERTIVFRLGKVRRGGARGPGIIWTLPCLDTAVVVDLRTGVYDIPSQDVLTKDSISVCVNAVVFWRVVDPMLAVCSDGDYKVSTQYKSQTVIRNILGTKNLTQILNEREAISKEMVENLQGGVRKIGVSIERIEMKEIGLPTSMMRAMAGEAEAKVQSKAKMVMSRGEAMANNKLVEAGDTLDVVSVHLRYLQTMMRISQPQDDNTCYLMALPLELKENFKSLLSGIFRGHQQMSDENQLKPKRKKKKIVKFE